RGPGAAGGEAGGEGAAGAGRGRGGAGRRAAGVVLGVPRVARLAVRKLDGAARRELREVQLAQEDAAGGGEAGHDGGVVVGHVVGEDARARRGAHATRVELVLHRERNAV